MSIALYTPATGFPDLEAKIAYGLARVGIEAYGSEKVTVQADSGFYKVTLDSKENEFDVLEKTFNMLCKRLLSSSYIPFSTPGIKGRSANSISVDENETFLLDSYKSITFISVNRKSENVCRHRNDSVGNIIGFAVATSYHHRRDGIDISIQQNIPRRPTNPKNICKTCALLALLGIWYASFIFNVSDREVVAIAIPKGKITGYKLQEIFALQHQIRKNWITQEIPEVLIPLIFLSKTPSSADILEGFDLFIGVLSQPPGGLGGYHVDGLFLINITGYLNFLKANPYNIATIEMLIRKESYSALRELNNVIYNGIIPPLAKFVRLYVRETSTNTFTNLLYPESSKYLLKEAAMISPEIIENQSLGSLSRTLRYFIREKKYGYADDIRNARKESKVFETTIAKMLREGRLRLEQKKKIHLPTDEEMKEVFRLANEDFENTKTALVILAFSFPIRAEEETVEIIEEVQNA